MKNPHCSSYLCKMRDITRSFQKLATFDSANIMARASRAYLVRIRRRYAQELDLQYEGWHDERCARFVEG